MSPTRLGCVAHRKTYKGKLFTRIKSLFFFHYLMRAKSRRERSTTLGQRHVAVRCGPAAMQGSLSTQAMSPLQSQCLLVSFSQILDRFHHHHLALRQHRHHLLVLLLQLPRLHSSRQPPFSTLPSVRELGGWERDAARRRKRLCGSEWRLGQERWREGW